MENKPRDSQLPKYFLSQDDTFALKLDRRGEFTVVSILSSKINDFHEVLLYCNEFKEFYLSEPNGEFILGNVDAFEISKLSFRLILPLTVVKLISMEDEKIFSFNNDLIEIEKIEESEDSHEIFFSSNLRINTTVIKTPTGKLKIDIENGKIKIPKIISANIQKVYIY